MIWNDLFTTLFWILKETKNLHLAFHFLDKLRDSFLNVYPTPPLIRIYPLLTINVHTKFHSTNNTAKNVQLLVSSASWLQRFASFLCVNRCYIEYSGNVFNRERKGGDREKGWHAVKGHGWNQTCAAAVRTWCTQSSFSNFLPKLSTRTKFHGKPFDR